MTFFDNRINPLSMEWIDSHCHLDGFFKKSELAAVLKKAEEAHVHQMIAIGTEPDDWDINHNLKLEFPSRIDYTVGMHPCYVKPGWRKSVDQLKAYFDRPQKPVALGEIGLDYYHLPKDQSEAEAHKMEQHDAFETQLAIARELDCPVVIHSRDAFEQTLQLIDNSEVNWTKIVVHCFSYSSEQIKQIIKRGGRASFTGIVTYKNAPNVKKALIEQGVDRLMIETDSPYLTPEPHRGKPNQPAYVADIGLKCAAYLGLEVETFAQKLAENTRSFFGLDKLK